MPDEYRESKKNGIYQFLSVVLDFFILYTFAFSFIGRNIVGYVENCDSGPEIQFIFCICIFAFIITVINILLMVFIEYIYGIETKNNDMFSYGLKKGILFVVYFIITIAYIYILNALIVWQKELWWIYALLIVILINVFTGVFIQKIIFSFFYKISIIENDEICEYIFKSADKIGIKIESIYVVDLNSEKNVINAAVIVFLKKVKIFISRKMLNQFSKKEITAVVFHELGHIKKQHLEKKILINVLFGIVGFAIIGNITINIKNEFIDMIRILFYIFVFLNISEFIEKLYLRRNEYLADLYSANKMGTNKYMISALNNTYKEDSKELCGSILSEIVNWEHPSIKRRIRNLERNEV